MGACLLFENMIDEPEAFISASSEATGFPAEMLLDMQRTMLWRTEDGIHQATISGDLGETRLCSALAIMNHNLTSYTGQITLQAAGQSWTWSAWEPLYAFGRGPFGRGPVGGYPSRRDIERYTAGTIRVCYFPPTRFQSFALTLSDASNPDGRLEAGRLFIGPHLATSLMPVAPAGIYPGLDPSSTNYTPGRQAVIERRLRYSQVRLSFENIPPKETSANWTRFLYATGSSEAFAVHIPDLPADLRFWTTLYGKRADKDKGQLSLERGFWGSADLTVEELR